MTDARPLVTFAIICYQQERYIRDALAGALAQDYQPLQIVLSDDASTDATFALASQIARDYKGPHRIVLHRNERNTGLTANVNQAVALAEGELIVLAAGDDISRPQRTSRTVERWIEEGRPKVSLCTAYLWIDADGKRMPGKPRPLPAAPVNLARWALSPFPLAYGPTQAIHRDLYEVFGALTPGPGSEDIPLAMRALALDGVRFIPEPLVLYRRHDRNLAGYIEDRPLLPQALYEEHLRYKRRAEMMRQILHDFRHPAFEARWGRAHMRRAAKACRKSLRRNEVMSAWLSAGSGRLPPGVLKKAWQWPPLLLIGARLMARRVFPGLHRAAFDVCAARWSRNYKRESSL